MCGGIATFAIPKVAWKDLTFPKHEGGLWVCKLVEWYGCRYAFYFDYFC